MRLNGVARVALALGVLGALLLSNVAALPAPARPLPPALAPVTVQVDRGAAPASAGVARPSTGSNLLTENLSLGAPGAEPLAALYDPANSIVYLEDAPAIVLEYSTITDQRIATITVSNNSAAAVPPGSIALDAATDTLWVLGPGALGVAALNTTTNAVGPAFGMPSSCAAIGGIALDPQTGAIWVACVDEILAFSPSNATLLYSLSVTYATGAIVYDPASNEVLASSYLDGNGSLTGLYAFDPVHYRLSGTVLTGVNLTGSNRTGAAEGIFPTGGMIYDPTTNEIVYTGSVPRNNWGVGAVNATTYGDPLWSEVNGHPVGVTAGAPTSPEVYLALYGSQGAGAFNLSTFELTSTARVNGTSAVVTYAPGNVYLATSDTAQLFVLPTSTFRVRATLMAGGGPGAIAYDAATHDLWVANSNNVTLVSDLEHQVVATIPVTFGPAALAVNATSDRAFVATYDDNNLTVYNATSYAVLDVVPIDSNPLAVMIDPITGDIYVACLNGVHGRVDIISSTTYQVLARLPVGNTPSNLLYDPVTQQIVVANTFSSNLSLISPYTQKIVGSVNLNQFYPWSEDGGFYPWGLAFDPVTRDLFLSDADLTFDVSTGQESSQVGAIFWNASAGNFSLAGYLNVDPVTLGIAYDPSDQMIFVASYIADTIDVIDPNTFTWNETLIAGGEPVPAFYDPSTGEIYVGNSLTANLTYIPAPEAEYGVTFNETGLASGSWSVTIDGDTEHAAAGAPISFDLPNGTYAYLVGPIAGYGAIYHGTLSVAGASLEVPIAFTFLTYALDFAETGLPAGTSWGVTVGDRQLASTSPWINLTEPNGTYGFSVAAVSGYAANVTVGSVTVSGSGRTVLIGYGRAPSTYAVTFEETGLPVETPWSITIDGTTENSTASTIAFDLMNGTYGYGISPIPGYSTAYHGSVSVAGSDLLLVIAFSSVEYTVTFTETGLPAGTSWAVTFAGATEQAAAGRSIVFSNVTNGTYAYSIRAEPGFSASPDAGRLTVAGGPVGAPTVTFTAVTYLVSFAEQGLPDGATWYVNLSSGERLSSTINGTEGTTVSAVLANGSYTASASTNEPGWSAAHSSAFTVAGGPASVTLPFTRGSSPGGNSGAGLFGLPGNDGVYLLAAAAVAAIGGLSAYLLRARHRIHPPR